jgi:hypothetical protein
MFVGSGDCRLDSVGGEDFNWPRANFLENWGQDGFFIQGIEYGRDILVIFKRMPQSYLNFFIISSLILSGGIFLSCNLFVKRASS